MEMNCTYSPEMTRKLPEFRFYCIDVSSHKLNYINVRSILDAFWSWLDEQKPRKGSCFETAVKYAQNRKDTLMTYLEDGHCSFSNNLSENAIRPFTVGRKNWLLSATPKGATASAQVYTMVGMAKANELNIYKYLTYLLEHRPSEDMSDEQLEALTPWSKEVQNVCKN